MRDDTRKEVELTVRAASGSRIQDALDLLRITWFRLHDYSQALQLKSTHQTSSLGHAHWAPFKQAMIASVTGLVSLGP